MNHQEFREKLKANGLDIYLEKIEPTLRTSIRLYQTTKEDKELPLGRTKIGGTPDLPTEFGWVTETNIVITNKVKYFFFNSKEEKMVVSPLSFIAQINLSEVSLFDEENILPKTGILYFFYSAEQEAWGFDIKDKNKFKIMYFDGNLSELSRADFPDDLPEYARFRSSEVTIMSEVSVPADGFEFHDMFTDDENEKFWEMTNEDEGISKMLGYSDNIQDDMELECELVTNGLYCGDPSGYNDPKAKLLEPNAKNWRLLLQIDSNDESEMMWGDLGRLYFWIKEQDLKNRDFKNAWFCLQCH